MTTGIKGPSGPGGPGGPTGPEGADDLAGADQAARADRSIGTGEAAGATHAGSTDPVVALAAELDAGRVSPEEALARLLDDELGGELEPGQRAELEALFSDLLANDPYLAGLARDVGAGGGDR